MRVRFLKEIQFPGHHPIAAGSEVEANTIPHNQASQLLASKCIEEICEVVALTEETEQSQNG